MTRIQLASLPSQTFQAVLDDQYCTITLYQRGKRLYLDLYANEHAVCRGAICLNRVDVIQSPSPYFNGSLYFYDLVDDAPPHWEELADRFALLFIPQGEEVPAELGAGGSS